jgi:hypothetical protein
MGNQIVQQVSQTTASRFRLSIHPDSPSFGKANGHNQHCCSDQENVERREQIYSFLFEPFENLRISQPNPPKTIIASAA